MKTSAGDMMTIELYPQKAPVTVENFLNYVDDEHYEGTVFHRVISDFMIQGGGFTLEDGIPTEKKTRDPIKNERDNGLQNKKYTLAMARTSLVDSATNQFFINTKNNPNLNYQKGKDSSGYAVVGKVVDGQDVVDKIAKMKTQTSKLKMQHPSGEMMVQPAKDVPVKPIVIESVSLVAMPSEEAAEVDPDPATKTEVVDPGAKKTKDSGDEDQKEQKMKDGKTGAALGGAAGGIIGLQSGKASSEEEKK